MKKGDAARAQNRLRQARIRQNWRQQDLADQLGTTVVTIKRWERGAQQPGAYFRVKLCTLFGISAEELGLVADESPDPSVQPEQSTMWSIPAPRNPFFTGRHRVLDRLHTLLTSEPTMAALTQSYALSGLGGIGKTQLAIEYAYQHRFEYQAVLWVEAETQTSLTASFIRLAELLALPQRTEEDHSKIVAAVLRWLNQHQGWLLIFDNVESLALLKPFLPANDQGALLLTTRLQTLDNLARRLELPPMTMQEGCDFLLARTSQVWQDNKQRALDPQERASVETIISEMGGLPLALEQAGAYIDSTHCSFADYARLFQRVQDRLLDEHNPANMHPLSVSRTFSLAFEQVTQHSPLAAELLTVCAFLAPDAIPETFFLEETSSGPLFKEMAHNPLAFLEAIKVLLSYSLVQRHAETRTISLHRLVQVILRQRIPSAEQEMWRRRVLSRLSEVFPDGSYPTWKQCDLLLPHVLVCVAALSEESRDLPLAHLAQKTATYLYECGQQPEQAEALYQRALHIYEEVLGPQHPEVATTLYGLASLSRHTGQYEMEAEPLYQRALSIYEQALGPQHSEVARVLHSLARLSWTRGNYQEAELFAQRALRIYEQVLEPDDTEMARALNGLALIYSNQGRYEEADPLYQRSLRIWLQTLGADHPNTGAALNNLAELYQEQGRYEEAETLYRQVLRIWEQALGADHPNIAVVFYNLAELFSKQRKYEEARQLYERAQSIWIQTFGPEHPHLGRVLNSLANLSQNLGQYEQARAFYQRALTLRQQHLNAPHPDIADTLYDLARFHQLQHEDAEAISLYQQALSMREAIYGSQHTKVAEVRETLRLLLSEVSGRLC